MNDMRSIPEVDSILCTNRINNLEIHPTISIAPKLIKKGYWKK